MDDNERYEYYEYARKKGKESAERIFKEKPAETQKILEEETTLGRPENLLDRSDEYDSNEAVITYAYPEEFDFLLYYASRTSDELIHGILNRGFVTNAVEAEHLALFFWRMVDLCVQDAGQSVQLPWADGAEFWNEKTMRSISSYLERAGYKSTQAAQPCTPCFDKVEVPARQIRTSH